MLFNQCNVLTIKVPSYYDAIIREFRSAKASEWSK